MISPSEIRSIFFRCRHVELRFIVYENKMKWHISNTSCNTKLPSSDQKSSNLTP